jgi:DNA end-binding protein Ku
LGKPAQILLAKSRHRVRIRKPAARKKKLQLQLILIDFGAADASLPRHGTAFANPHDIRMWPTAPFNKDFSVVTFCRAATAAPWQEAIAMPARPSWDGFLKVNLLAVPVKAYSAAVSGGGKIHFHLVHKKCNNRIRYKKVCPIHGEVEKEEIVTAYEFAKHKVVIVEPEELDKLRTEQDKAISIDAFIRAEQLDPVYLTGRTYYLVPDGRVAQKPYAVLQEVMAGRDRYGIAQLVLTGREQLAVVRAVQKGLLTMTVLNYADQVRQPTALAEDLSEAHITAEERHLAETLIDASTVDDFDIAGYKDEYTAKLTRLIEAKTKGKKIAAPTAHDEPVVINLMDALRESLRRAQKGGGRKKAATARGKTTAHGRKTAPLHGKRKTG